MIEIALVRRSPEERNAWMEGYEAGRHLRLDTLQEMIDAAYVKGYKKRLSEEPYAGCIYFDTDSFKCKREDEDA